MQIMANIKFKEFMYGLGTWADIDNDKDLDLIVASNLIGLNNATIYKNNISTTNVAPSPPTNVVGMVSGNTLTISWKDYPEIVMVVKLKSN